MAQQPPAFVLAGANASASLTPRPGGFAAYGTPIASDKLSWSSYSGSITTVAGKPTVTTQATTGVAQRVANFTAGSWQFQGWIIGALGPGQAGSVTSLALNAGAGVSISRKSWTHLFAWAGWQASQLAGKSSAQVQLAWGWRENK